MPRSARVTRRKLRRAELRPAHERILDKIRVVITGITSDFVAKPYGLSEGLVFALELQLCNDQSCVVAEELVDFPGEIASEDLVALLLDQRLLGKRIQHRFAFIERNFVLVFGPGRTTR